MKLTGVEGLLTAMGWPVLGSQRALTGWQQPAGGSLGVTSSSTTPVARFSLVPPHLHFPPHAKGGSPSSPNLIPCWPRSLSLLVCLLLLSPANLPFTSFDFLDRIVQAHLHGKLLLVLSSGSTVPICAFGWAATTEPR